VFLLLTLPALAPQLVSLLESALGRGGDLLLGATTTGPRP
jgi:hypothetical protein